MLKDTILEIKEVEKEADEMCAKALEDAKNAVISADEESNRIKIDAVNQVKAERKKVIEAAEKDATKQYDLIINSGIERAKELKEKTDTSKAVDFIKEKLVSSYGSR